METATFAQIQASFSYESGMLLRNNLDKKKEVDELIEMGFRRSENVLDYNDWVEHKEFANEYKLRYPYKYITSYRVDKLLKKYNLINGAIKNYIGSIPSKNINELLSAQFYVQDFDEYEVNGIYINPYKLLNSIHHTNTNDYLNSLGPKTTFKELCKKIPWAVTIAADPRLFTEPTSLPLDPVVLVSVIGGFLIPTAWEI